MYFHFRPDHTPKVKVGSCVLHENIPHPTPPDALEIVILSGQADRMSGLYTRGYFFGIEEGWGVGGGWVLTGNLDEEDV